MATPSLVCLSKLLVCMCGIIHSIDSPLQADLWLLNSCTVKGPSEDSLNNSIRKGRQLGKPLVISGCVPQGQRKHSDIQGLSVVGVRWSCLKCKRWLVWLWACLGAADRSCG